MRQFGAIFSKVGFNDAQVLLIDGQLKAAGFPELAHRLPELIRRAVDHQPTLVARALNAHIAHIAGSDADLAGTAGLVALEGVGRHGHARHGVAVVTRELAQVRRYIQRRAFGGARFVVDFFTHQGVVDGGAAAEQHARQEQRQS